MKLITRTSFAVLIAFCTFSAFAQGPNTGKGSATFRSDKGDYIGGGKNWTIASSQGDWSSFLNDANADGIPDLVHVAFNANQASGSSVGSWWDWYFDASLIKKNLSPGAFTSAIRYPFNDGANGIDVSGDGRGCNRIKGSFVISSLAWDCNAQGSSLHLRKFIATFEQRCGDDVIPALRGTVTYTADAATPCSGGGGDTGGGDTGGGDTGGGDTPSGETFQVLLPGEFVTDPLMVANGTVTTVSVVTLTDGVFESDVQLFASADAQDFENFRVELAPSTIPSPGVGATELRIITGPQTFPRTYLVTVTGLASDRGASASLLVNVTCDPPTILGLDQPKSISAANGSQVTLEVKPTGSGPFSYQWYKGVPGMTRQPVLAANESKLIFTTRETATYWVRVSNACGTADSNGATVTTTGSLTGPARRRGGKS